MALKNSRLGGSRSRDVRATTMTRTIHYVDVDLVAVLAEFDPADEVVLVIGTPSGRGKRVKIHGGDLVSPMPVEDAGRWDA